MRYSGADFLLEIWDGTAWQSCLSDRSTSFTVGNEQVDTTEKGSTPWRQLGAFGIRSGDVSCSGVATDRIHYQLLMAASIAGTSVDAHIIHGPTAEVVWEANVLVGSMERTGEYNGAEMYSLSLISLDTAVNLRPTDSGQWQPDTRYRYNQEAQNGSHIYICTRGGMSAHSGGPTGLGTGIVDNTVTWSYLHEAPLAYTAYVGTSGGLYAYNNLTLSWDHITAIPSVYCCVSIDADGTIYAGTAGRIDYSTDKGVTWTTVTLSTAQGVTLSGSTLRILGKVNGVYFAAIFSQVDSNECNYASSQGAYSSDLATWTYIPVGSHSSGHTFGDIGYAYQFTVRGAKVYIADYGALRVVDMSANTIDTYTPGLGSPYNPPCFTMTQGETDTWYEHEVGSQYPILFRSATIDADPYPTDNPGFTTKHYSGIRVWNPGHGKVFAGTTGNNQFGGQSAVGQTLDTKLSYVLSASGVDGTSWAACTLPPSVAQLNRSALMPLWNSGNVKYQAFATWDDSGSTRVLQSLDGITWTDDASIPGVYVDSRSGAVAVP